MKRRLISRTFALVLTAAITASAFVGCSSKNNSNATVEQSLVYNVGQQPDTVDPGLSTTIGGANVGNAVFEGLMKLDESNNPVPATAEKVEFDEVSGTKYTFYIRKNAKWSDGQPVTAKDFEYAWKRVLDPNTASDYANQLYYLKNGKKFNAGEGKAEEVGVKAIDDYTLEVELEDPTPYFLQLCSMPTLFPVRKDIVEKDPERWAINAETFIGNGPFKMTSWTQDASMEFVRNENYWNKDTVKLDKLKFVMIAESTSALSAFETGEIDYMDDIPTNDIPRLMEEKKITQVPYIGNYYISLNTKAKGLDNVKVRKALSLAIDRTALIEAVWKDGRKPATAWVPFGIADADTSKDYRTVGGDYYDGKANVEEAKKLLAEAGYADGKGLPTIEYAYNKSETHAKIAQAVQDMWKKNLGVEVKLNEVDWKVFVPQRKVGDYQIARDGWIGDYLDPMTFMDILVTGDGNNHPQYSNEKYDGLIAAAKKEKDTAKRMKMIHEAEDILIEDMPLIPISFYVNNVLAKPYVKASHKTPTGMVYFDKAYIEGKTSK